MASHSCAALVIAAPASGQGKTSVTAALAFHYRQQAKQVRVFKVGPDFLDPMILERASGHPVYQLDLWMVGEQQCRRLLSVAAKDADLILIEGVMGLFDGEPSTADLAARLGIPVLAVIDASAMAQTFAAIAHGLATFRQDVTVAGIVANRVGSDYHRTLLSDALPENLPYLATLYRQHPPIFPDRYLGLKQAAEIEDIEERLQQLADKLKLNPALTLPQTTFDKVSQSELVKRLSGVRIAVARDDAFSFLYQANLDVLEQLGAELAFFSPLKDTTLPEADSLYLPGGYPELHLQQLAENTAMANAIKRHFDANKPIVAECGGMLYLTERLTDKQGDHGEMVGILPARAELQPRLTALALQEVTLNQQTLRGHTYHHSTLHSELQPVASGNSPNEKQTSEAVYQLKRLSASYIHFYFPSNPQLVADLFLP
jgi:cobyrinic acid a,c-diamide synthase